MIKNILKLEGAQQLSKKEQSVIKGGQGPYSLKCNSGVWIQNSPDSSAATGAIACANQGGYTGTWMCVGPDCPGIE